MTLLGPLRSNFGAPGNFRSPVLPRPRRGAPPVAQGRRDRRPGRRRPGRLVARLRRRRQRRRRGRRRPPGLPDGRPGGQAGRAVRRVAPDADGGVHLPRPAAGDDLRRRLGRVGRTAAGLLRRAHLGIPPVPLQAGRSRPRRRCSSSPPPPSSSSRPATPSGRWTCWLPCTTGPPAGRGATAPRWVRGRPACADLDGLTLGDNFVGSAPLAGDVAEVLVYAAGLSDADRSAVEHYLLDKYGI